MCSQIIRDHFFPPKTDNIVHLNVTKLVDLVIIKTVSLRRWLLVCPKGVWGPYGRLT